MSPQLSAALEKECKRQQPPENPPNHTECAVVEMKKETMDPALNLLGSTSRDDIKKKIQVFMPEEKSKAPPKPKHTLMPPKMDSRSRTPITKTRTIAARQNVNYTVMNLQVSYDNGCSKRHYKNLVKELLRPYLVDPAMDHFNVYTVMPVSVFYDNIKQKNKVQETLYPYLREPAYAPASPQNITAFPVQVGNNKTQGSNNQARACLWEERPQHCNLGSRLCKKCEAESALTKPMSPKERLLWNNKYRRGPSESIIKYISKLDGGRLIQPQFIMDTSFSFPNPPKMATASVVKKPSFYPTSKPVPQKLELQKRAPIDANKQPPAKITQNIGAGKQQPNQEKSIQQVVDTIETKILEILKNPAKPKIDAFNSVEKEITDILETIRTSKQQAAATKLPYFNHQPRTIMMDIEEESPLTEENQSTASLKDGKQTSTISSLAERSSKQLEKRDRIDLSKTTLDEVESKIMESTFDELEEEVQEEAETEKTDVQVNANTNMLYERVTEVIKQMEQCSKEMESFTSPPKISLTDSSRSRTDTLELEERLRFLEREPLISIKEESQCSHLESSQKSMNRKTTSFDKANVRAHNQDDSLKMHIIDEQGETPRTKTSSSSDVTKKNVNVDDLGQSKANAKSSTKNLTITDNLELTTAISASCENIQDIAEPVELQTVDTIVEVDKKMETTDKREDELDDKSRDSEASLMRLLKRCREIPILEVNGVLVSKDDDVRVPLTTMIQEAEKMQMKKKETGGRIDKGREETKKNAPIVKDKTLNVDTMVEDAERALKETQEQAKVRKNNEKEENDKNDCKNKKESNNKNDTTGYNAKEKNTEQECGKRDTETARKQSPKRRVKRNASNVEKKSEETQIISVNYLKNKNGQCVIKEAGSKTKYELSNVRAYLSSHIKEAEPEMKNAEVQITSPNPKVKNQKIQVNAEEGGLNANKKENTANLALEIEAGSKILGSAIKNTKSVDAQAKCQTVEREIGSKVTPRRTPDVKCADRRRVSPSKKSTGKPPISNEQRLKSRSFVKTEPSETGSPKMKTAHPKDKKKPSGEQQNKILSWSSLDGFAKDVKLRKREASPGKITPTPGADKDKKCVRTPKLEVGSDKQKDKPSPTLKEQRGKKQRDQSTTATEHKKENRGDPLKEVKRHDDALVSSEDFLTPFMQAIKEFRRSETAKTDDDILKFLDTLKRMSGDYIAVHVNIYRVQCVAKLSFTVNVQHIAHCTMPVEYSTSLPSGVLNIRTVDYKDRAVMPIPMTYARLTSPRVIAEKPKETLTSPLQLDNKPQGNQKALATTPNHKRALNEEPSCKKLGAKSPRNQKDPPVCHAKVGLICATHPNVVNEKSVEVLNMINLIEQKISNEINEISNELNAPNGPKPTDQATTTPDALGKGDGSVVKKPELPPLCIDVFVSSGSDITSLESSSDSKKLQDSFAQTDISSDSFEESLLQRLESIKKLECTVVGDYASHLQSFRGPLQVSKGCLISTADPVPKVVRSLNEQTNSKLMISQSVQTLEEYSYSNATIVVKVDSIEKLEQLINASIKANKANREKSTPTILPVMYGVLFSVMYLGLNFTFYCG